MKRKKIIVAGATGFLGKSLADFYTEQGHEVFALVRSEEGHQAKNTLVWDGKNIGPWANEFNYADVDALNNVCAPQPERNDQMMRLLRENLRMKIGIRADEWILEIGAFVLRTESELVLKSRKVIPKRPESLGFKFIYPNMYDARKNLMS